MKKLFLLLTFISFSFIIFAQTDYEKYWLEKEKQEHPTLFEENDTIVIYDTVWIENEQESDIVIYNNYSGFYTPWYLGYYPYYRYYNPWYYYSHYPYYYSYYDYYPYYRPYYINVNYGPRRSSSIYRQTRSISKQIPKYTNRTTITNRRPISRVTRPVVHRKVTVNRNSSVRKPTTRTQKYTPNYKRASVRTSQNRSQYNNSGRSTYSKNSTTSRSSSSRNTVSRSSSSRGSSKNSGTGRKK